MTAPTDFWGYRKAVQSFHSDTALFCSLFGVCDLFGLAMPFLTPHSSLLIPHLTRALIQSLLIMPNLLRTWSLRQVFPFSPLAFSCPMYGSVPTIPRNLSLVRRCHRQLLYVSAVSLYQGGSLLPLLSLWVNAYCLCHFVLSAPVAYRLALSLPLG